MASQENVGLQTQEKRSEETIAPHDTSEWVDLRQLSTVQLHWKSTRLRSLVHYYPRAHVIETIESKHAHDDGCHGQRPSRQRHG